MRATAAALALSVLWVGSADAADMRVEAFKAACIPARASFEQNRAQIEKLGWHSVSEDSNAHLAAVTRASRKMVPELWASGQHALFTKTEDKYTLYVVLDVIHPKTADALGCYLYDFEGKTAPDATAFREWLGKPSQIVNQPGDASAEVWKQPPNVPNAGLVRWGLIEKGGPSANMIGFSGAMFAISTLLPKSN